MHNPLVNVLHSNEVGRGTWFEILKFTLQQLYDAQTPLLRYVLEQPYSRDMVCSILSLNKQVIQSLILNIL